MSQINNNNNNNIYQGVRIAPSPIKLKKATIIQNEVTSPIITLNNLINNDENNLNQIKPKQTSYTITRTYVAPNGITKTRTIEYHGDEAKKLINEMKEREVGDANNIKSNNNNNNTNNDNDNELIKNIEEQFENITNPDLWLEHGFTTVKMNNNNKILNDNNNKKYLNNNNNDNNCYESSEPLKIIKNVKNQQQHSLKGCYQSKNSNQQSAATTAKFLFIKEALDQHNRYRYVHRVPYLKLNKDLCNSAQQWAEQIANTGKFEHSNNKYMNQSLGENIAMRFTSTHEELGGKQMTDQWYEEASSYDYNLDFQSGKGHFAQIVWKNTREVGFGRAQSKDGKWYAVANYYPAGNYIGHFRENVYPPLSNN